MKSDSDSYRDGCTCEDWSIMPSPQHEKSCPLWRICFSPIFARPNEERECQYCGVKSRSASGTSHKAYCPLNGIDKVERKAKRRSAPEIHSALDLEPKFDKYWDWDYLQARKAGHPYPALYATLRSPPRGLF